MNDATKRRYSFTLGYLMGVCGPVVSFPEKQPTAYSYNGVVLPKLPEWDKTVYPYVIIQYYTESSDYFFRAFTDPLVSKTFAGLEMLGFDDGEAEQIHCKLVDGEWSEWSSATSTYITPLGVLWTKPPHDILNEDGTLYLAASDPIPVYE